MLGRKLLDEFGEVVISTKLCRYGWRTRHTQIEKLIVKKCVCSGVPVQIKIFHLFYDVIPQAGCPGSKEGGKK